MVCYLVDECGLGIRSFDNMVEAFELKFGDVYGSRLHYRLSI